MAKLLSICSHLRSSCSLGIYNILWKGTLCCLLMCIDAIEFSIDVIYITREHQNWNCCVFSQTGEHWQQTLVPRMRWFRLLHRHQSGPQSQCTMCTEASIAEIWELTIATGQWNQPNSQYTRTISTMSTPISGNGLCLNQSHHTQEYIHTEIKVFDFFQHYLFLLCLI